MNFGSKTVLAVAMLLCSVIASAEQGEADGRLWHFNTAYVSGYSGAELTYTSYSYVSPYGLQYKGSAEPALTGDYVFPEDWQVPVVSTNGYNYYDGTTLVHRETVSTNYYKLVSVGQHAFGDCVDLKSVRFPSSLRELADSAFAGCTNLVSITGLENVQDMSAKSFEGTPFWANLERESGDFVVLNGVLLEYRGTDETVYVPDQVSCIAKGAFSNNQSVKRIVISDSVSRICDYAFQSCQSLESLKLPANQRFNAIPSGLCQGCESLASVEIPDTVTSVNSGAFRGCARLENITGGKGVRSVAADAFADTPSTDTSAPSFRLSILGSVLFGYRGSPSGALIIPEGVSTINSSCCFSGYENRGLFENCERITSVTLPNTLSSLPYRSESSYDQGLGVWTYEYFGCFQNCTGIRSVRFGSSSYSYSVSRCAFRGCTSLESVDFGDGYVYSVEESAFEDCDALKSVCLPKSVSSIGSKAFAYSGLTELNGGMNLYRIAEDAFDGTPLLDLQTGDYVVIGSLLFEYWGDGDFVMPAGATGVTAEFCQNHPEIYSVTIPQGGVMPRSLYSLPCLEEINFEGEIDGAITYDGVVYDRDMVRLVRCPRGREASPVIPEGVREISEDAFSDCALLDHVVLPSSLEVIGPYAFVRCSGLSGINLPAAVRWIGDYAFGGCDSLDAVSGGASVTMVGSDSFCDTPYLENLPSGLVVLGKAVVGYKDSCPATLSIPEGVVSIAPYAFYGCESLTALSLPSSLRVILDGAFEECGNLATVTGGAGVRHCCRWAFDGCYNLESNSVPMPAGWLGVHCACCGYDSDEDGPVIVGSSFLWYNGVCPANYTIPEGVETISAWAFDGQDEVECITLPSSVKVIENYAFCGCYNLQAIYGGSGVEEASINMFGYEDEYMDLPLLADYSGAYILGRCLIRHFGDQVESYTVPDGVEYIAGRAFAGCSVLSTVNGGAGLKKIAYNAFDGTKVSVVGQFWVGPTEDEKKVDSLIIPEGVRVVMGGAEGGWRSVSMPSTVETICDRAFSGCKNLTEVNLGGVKRIYADVAGYDDLEADDDCPYTYLCDNEWVYWYDADEECDELPYYPYPFANCGNLRKVVISNPEVEIGHGAFRGCNLLNDVEISVPEGMVFAGWEDAYGINYGESNLPIIAGNGARAIWTAWVPPVEPKELAPELYGNPTAGEFEGNSTYSGWVKDASGKVVGSITITAGKPNKKGVSKLKAELAIIGSKKVKFSGEAIIGEGTAATLTSKGASISLQFGRDGFVGTYGDYVVTGGRDMFASKDKASKAKADEFAQYKGSYAVALYSELVGSSMSYCGWNGLTVTVAAKGKTTISGKLCDGQKVSVSSQMIIGEGGVAVVPVLAQLYSGKKGGFAFLLWFTGSGVKVTDASEWKGDALKVPFAATWLDIRCGRVDASAAPAVSAFMLDASFTTLRSGAIIQALAPYTVPVSSAGKKWKVEKASKVSRDGMSDGPNPAALKLAYTPKTGKFEGSFKAYYLDAKTGKIKSENATVEGVTIDGVGYGCATIKKNGAWPIMIK